MNLKKNFIYVSIILPLFYNIIFPTQLFFNNTQEFFINYNQIIMLLFIKCLVYFIIISIIGYIIYKVNNKLFIIYNAILISILIIIWLNSFFFGVEGLIDGTEHVNIYGITSVANIIVSILIFLIVFYFIIKKKNHIITLLITIILLSSSISSLTVYIKSPHIDRETAGTQQYRIDDSGERLLSFSDKKNIVYIILDTYDAKYLKRILQNDADGKYENIIKDFTFFTNYISIYSATKGTGFPQFAGKIYENEEKYNDFRNSVYSSGYSIFELLKKQSWDIMIYPDQNIGGTGLYSPFIEIYENKIENDKIEQRRAVEKLMNISLYIYSPVILKNKIRYMQTVNTNDVWDFNFNTILDKKKIYTGKIDNQFILIHLSGAHLPYLVNENLEIDKKASVYSQAKASLVLMSKLLTKMKEANVYDNSVIIITADHGGISPRINPILLIKDINQKQPKLSYDNRSVYQAGIKNILEEYIVNDNYSNREIKETKNRITYFYDGLQEFDREYMPPMYSYKVPDYIRDNLSMRDLEYVSYYAPKIPIWNVGEKITINGYKDFPEGSLSKTWQDKNGAIDGYKNIWMKLDSQKEYRFMLKFYLQKQDKIVNVTFKQDTANEKISYNLNDSNIIEKYIEAKDFVDIFFHEQVEIERIEIEPMNHAAENLEYTNNVKHYKDKIKDNVYSRLVFPQGYICLEYKNYDNLKNIVIKQDEKLLYLGKENKKLCIPSQELAKDKNGAFKLDFEYENQKLEIKNIVNYSQLLQQEMFFIKEDDYPISVLPNMMFKKGWYQKERTLCWSRKNSVLSIPLHSALLNKKEITVGLKGRVKLDKNKRPNTIGFYMNGKLLNQYHVNDLTEQLFEIVLDNKMIQSVVNIEIRADYQVSPSAIGENKDGREVAFAINDLRIYEPVRFSYGEYLVKNIDKNAFKSNWYSKEPGLIWSSNNAVVGLPLSKELQETGGGIFIDIKGRLYFNKNNDIQTLGIYADNNLLKEFEVINNDYNTYTVEVPKKYIKDILNLTIRTKYNSSPKLDGKGDDGRMLGFALTGINIKKDNNAENKIKEEKVSYSQIFNQGEYSVENIDNSSFKSNWYSKEPTLIWTSNNAELMLPLSKALQEQESIFIDLKGRLYFNKNNDIQTLGIYTDNNLLKEFEVKNNSNNLYTVEVPKKYIKDILNLTIRTKYNSSPKLDGKGDDGRMLGFALTGINIRNDNNTKSAAQNEIKYVVKDIALMGGKGWYQPEQELIWSRKNAELLIPVSNTDNAATINITLKGQSFIDTAKKQKLSIYYKDNKVKEYKVNDNNIHDYSFTIDVDKNMEYIPLKIESAYEEQPKNTGESLDDRLLAFGIREIVIKWN